MVRPDIVVYAVNIAAVHLSAKDGAAGHDAVRLARFYGTLASRLRTTPYGAGALELFEQNPSGQAERFGIDNAIKMFASHDPTFGVWLSVEVHTLVSPQLAPLTAATNVTAPFPTRPRARSSSSLGLVLGITIPLAVLLIAGAIFIVFWAVVGSRQPAHAVGDCVTVKMDHNKHEFVELATVDCTSADPNAVQITQVFKNNLGPAYMYCTPTGIPEPNYFDHSTQTLYCALPLHPAEFNPF